MKFLFVALLLFKGIANCQSNNEKVMTEKVTYKTNFLPDSLIISPLYPDTVYFSAQADIYKQTVVKGNPEGFHNRTSHLHELYFQRLAGKEGTFRVIHCVGTGLETVSEFGKESSMIKPINETFSFDELGIFKGKPSDPVDLIPLYPGHPVKLGEHWKPEVEIEIPMGAGVAKFDFVIDSVYEDKEGAVLALIKVNFNGNLTPSEIFKGGQVTAVGEGWLIWDCTINQRRETNISATYLASNELYEVQQLIRLNDELRVNTGRKQF